jgi:hypothetical protein
MLNFRNFLTYYLSIEFITLVKNKIEIKTYKKCVKVFLKNYLIGKGTVHVVQPITAQCGPAQKPRHNARGALTRAPGRNLGLGRESGAPPGPKVARTPAERPRPSDRDRRSRVDLGGSKTPSERFSRKP